MPGKRARKDRGGQRQHGFRPPAEGEACCAVVRILGGKQAEVMRPDGEKMRCIIRSKFTGRRKRENLLSAGTWVLVGFREWENGVGDLLHVYDAGDVQQLRRILEPSMVRHLSQADPLAAAAASSSSRGDGDDVVFEDNLGQGVPAPSSAEVSAAQEDCDEQGDDWIDMEEI